MATDRPDGFDVAATLAAVRSRDLNREGIPMFLELGGAHPAPVDDPRRRTGRRLAARLIAIHEALAREHREAGRATLGAEPAAEAVVEGVNADLADVLEDEAEAEIPEEERLVAEAISVLAHHEVDVATPAAARPAPGAPAEGSDAEPVPALPADASATLARIITALCEGRFLTVVNYHNTPEPMGPALRRELAGFARDHSPVTTGDLQRLISTGVWNDPRPPLIPVFYEGYRNNHDVAAPACESVGLVGWFFLITGFLQAPVAEQAAFADAHDIGLADEERDGTRLAMTWEEAAALTVRHVVTSHTAHHVTARSVADEAGVQTELEQPSEAIEAITGRPSVAHAWLYGSGLQPGRLHVETLRRLGYRWVFSNLAVDDVARLADAQV